MDFNEQIWLMQLEKGEDNAFRVLFEGYYARLCMFACKYVEEQVVAEDVVQDILYELWLKKLHFENLLTLKAYLYNMLRNRCLDLLKHKKVQKKYADEQKYKEDSEFFLQQMMEDEVYTLLKNAITALPQQTGKVFELSLNGHDNNEIASILHLSLDAVKAHKKRGKKLLQERLKGLIYFLWLTFCKKIKKM